MLWPLALKMVDTLGDSLQSFQWKFCVVQECLPATLPACPSPAWTSAGSTEPFPAPKDLVAASQALKGSSDCIFPLSAFVPIATALDSPA